MIEQKSELQTDPTGYVVTIWNQLSYVLKKFWLGVSLVLGNLVLVILLLFVIATQSDLSTPDERSLTKQLLYPGDSDATIAVVSLNGMIVENSGSSDPLSFSDGLVSARNTTIILDQLAEDEEVTAIILRINSPGGTVAASDELYKKIASVAEKKLVIASFGDLAASGGYYIAMGADHIVANPSSLTGSIGVILETPDVTELLDTVGVSMRTYKSGELKDLGSPTRAITEQEDAILQALVDDSYQEFLQVVATGRGTTVDEIKPLADGRIYTGKQAHQVGLVDQLGTFEDAIAYAHSQSQSEEAQVVEYGSQSFLESLLGAKFSLLPLGGIEQRYLSHGGLYYLVSF